MDYLSQCICKQVNCSWEGVDSWNVVVAGFQRAQITFVSVMCGAKLIGVHDAGEDDSSEEAGEKRLVCWAQPRSCKSHPE